MKYDAKIEKELIDLKERLEKPGVDVKTLIEEAEYAGLRCLVVTTVFKKRFPVEHAKWENED